MPLLAGTGRRAATATCGVPQLDREHLSAATGPMFADTHAIWRSANLREQTDVIVGLTLPTARHSPPISVRGARVWLGMADQPLAPAETNAIVPGPKGNKKGPAGRPSPICNITASRVAPGGALLHSPGATSGPHACSAQTKACTSFIAGWAMCYGVSGGCVDRWRPLRLPPPTAACMHNGRRPSSPTACGNWRRLSL